MRSDIPRERHPRQPSRHCPPATLRVGPVAREQFVQPSDDHDLGTPAERPCRPGLRRLGRLGGGSGLLVCGAGGSSPGVTEDQLHHRLSAPLPHRALVPHDHRLPVGPHRGPGRAGLANRSTAPLINAPFTGSTTYRSIVIPTKSLEMAHVDRS